MKTYGLWLSLYTNRISKQPEWWSPRYKGWQFLEWITEE